MNLSTSYLGLNLKNPIVPSAGPFSGTIDSMKQLEDSGASAIVLYSLFEEQLEQEAAELNRSLEQGADSTSESTSYFPKTDEYRIGPDAYLEHIRKAKEALKIPVIASLNGYTAGGWVSHAKKMQQAGADALELNIYYIPTDTQVASTEVENIYVAVTKAVRKEVTIPIAIKLSPFFSSTANIAKKFDEAGADGLVLFNRFYQPDIDLEKLEIYPNLVLSNSNEIRLPLRWIAILYGKIKASLAATSGIHTAEDVIKMLMAGADVTMMCSAILENGPKHIIKVLDDMKVWMEKHEYESVQQMKGSMSQKSVPNPAAFERGNYMKVLQSYK